MNQLQTHRARGSAKARASRSGLLLYAMLLATPLASGLVGCGAREPGFCIIAVGRSGSEGNTQTTRREMAALDTVVEALPSNTEIAVWRYDTTVQPLFSARVDDPESLAEIQERDLRPASTRPGSRLDLALAEIAHEVQRRPEATVSAVVITDGENTGARPDAAIATLSRARRLKVLWVTGLASQFQQPLSRQLSPLGQRVIQGGWADLEQDAATFGRQVRQVTVR